MRTSEEPCRALRFPSPWRQCLVKRGELISLRPRSLQIGSIAIGDYLSQAAAVVGGTKAINNKVNVSGIVQLVGTTTEAINIFFKLKLNINYNV